MLTTTPQRIQQENEQQMIHSISLGFVQSISNRHVLLLKFLHIEDIVWKVVFGNRVLSWQSLNLQLQRVWVALKIVCVVSLSDIVVNVAQKLLSNYCNFWTIGGSNLKQVFARVESGLPSKFYVSSLPSDIVVNVAQKLFSNYLNFLTRVASGLPSKLYVLSLQMILSQCHKEFTF